MTNYSRSPGILADISQNVQIIFLIHDQRPFVTIAEYPVDSPRISAEFPTESSIEFEHKSIQIGIRRSEQHMVVIFHDDKKMDLNRMDFIRPSDAREEALPHKLQWKVEPLLVVASEGDVIK
jgi:hypothetical protein